MWPTDIRKPRREAGLFFLLPNLRITDRENSSAIYFIFVFSNIRGFGLDTVPRRYKYRDPSLRLDDTSMGAHGGTGLGGSCMRVGGRLNQAAATG